MPELLALLAFPLVLFGVGLVLVIQCHKQSTSFVVGLALMPFGAILGVVFCVLHSLTKAWGGGHWPPG